MLAALQRSAPLGAGFAVGPLLRRWNGPTIIAAGTLLVVGLVARASGNVAVVALGSVCVGAGLPAEIATSITQARWTAHLASTASMVGAVTTILFIPHALGFATGSLVVEHLDHRLLLVTSAAGLLTAAAGLRQQQGSRLPGR